MSPAGSSPAAPGERPAAIPAEGVQLDGTLTIPDGAHAVVLFAHGSGSSRFSPRNRFVARQLHDAHLATLLIDLLTPSEERVDAATAQLRFDIPLLARRLVAATDWLCGDPPTAQLRVGYFGASTGAAAALVAAAQRLEAVGAIVSRGGRPDLAADVIPRVRAPTLLIVGAQDRSVLTMNRHALDRLSAEKELSVVPGATHLFEEPGALEHVARLAVAWFRRHLAPPAAGTRT
jgi:dienelactone hydrolase